MRGESGSIVYIGSYPPRECGIATFTRDLATAFAKRFNPTTKTAVIALNENEMSFYNYPDRVTDSIAADNLENYVALAKKINANPAVRLVNIQHEFGIFGGAWGDYLIPFLQVVAKPVVVTFHSVISDPEADLKRVVQSIAAHARALVVMNDNSRHILETDYGVAPDRIFLIPHGIPHATFEPTKEAKTALGLDGRTVLSTFGLISRDKGIEYAIRAMKPLAEKFPNLLYLVLGATHPVVQRDDGEEYRNFLTAEVERLGLKDHVLFYNKYMTLEEIVAYLKATDLYISPALNPKQSVSGTLSYALGCGRAVVATPTDYAKHIITNENGRLAKFRNVSSIASAAEELLADEKLLRSMHAAAYEATRHMTWPNVAAAYFSVYKRFADIRSEERKLPDIKLDHLVRLTDDFGVLHHARYGKPERRFGYSTDDNARALALCAQINSFMRDDRLPGLMRTYLRFLKFAQRPNGTFSAIVSAHRRRDGAVDEDVQGRALWALGVVTARSNELPDDIAQAAETLFRRALPAAGQISSPLATAFAMTGLHAHLRAFPNADIRKTFVAMANRQLKTYRAAAAPDWQWFEDHLTYSNSKLPESLFYAYDLTRNPKYRAAAEESLAFLRRITFEPKYYSPIGQNGWYFRDKQRAYFDQQPEDAASTVQTKVVAYRVTGDKAHLRDAFKAFQWFLGKNHLGLMVYNEVTGGCHDGVGRDGINLNQGAESTISHLLARVALEEIKEDLPAGRHGLA